MPCVGCFPPKTPSNGNQHTFNTKNQKNNLSVRYECFDGLGFFNCLGLVLTVFSGENTLPMPLKHPQSLNQPSLNLTIFKPINPLM